MRKALLTKYMIKTQKSNGNEIVSFPQIECEGVKRQCVYAGKD